MGSLEQARVTVSNINIPTSIHTSSSTENTVIRLHISHYSSWRHQMETFFALLTICAGNSPVTGKFPAQRPVTRSFDVFFDLRLNKRLSKQWWGWWFETQSRLLWRHRNIDCNYGSTWHVACFIAIFSAILYWYIAILLTNDPLRRQVLIKCCLNPFYLVASF